MAIKRRKKRTVSRLSNSDSLVRFGDLLAAGHGTKRQAKSYMYVQYKDRLSRMQSIVTLARAARSWNIMEGAYKQAAELYVLASVLYERHPEHVIMPDAVYDQLARWLLRNIDELPEDFLDWYQLTAAGFEASTGHNVQEQEPILWMVAIHLGTISPPKTKQRIRHASAPVLQRKTKPRIRRRPRRG